MASCQTDLRRPLSQGAGLPTRALLVIASVTSAGLGYAWTIVTGRMLSAAEYADFGAAASIVYIAATAMAPGTQTLAYFTAVYVAGGDPDSARALERRALRFVGLAGSALVAIAALASSSLSTMLHFRSQTTVVLAAAAAVAVGVLNVKRGWLLGQQRFQHYSWNIIAESLLRVLLAFVLLLLGARAAASLAAYVVTAFLAALALASWRKGDPRDVDMVAVRRYLAPVFTFTIIYAGFQNLDVLIVKRLFSPSEAAVYGAASFLSRAAGMLVMPFVAFAVPHMVEILDDPTELRRRFLRICIQYFVLAGAAVAIIGSESRRILAVLFGPAYAPAAHLLLPLSGAIALSGLVFLLCQLPVAMNRFAFIRWYAVGLIIEIAALARFHRTLLQIATVLIIVNAVTMALVIPHLWPRSADKPRLEDAG